MKTFHIFLVIIEVYSITCLNIINLTNEKWILTSENKSIKVAGSVPGGIYTDLWKAGVLKENPLYGYNDVKYRSISQQIWTYSSNFQLDKEFLSHDHIDIIFHGIDTFADVFLNDFKILHSNNMFVKYEIDVNDILQINNSLRIVLFPAVKVAEELSKNASHAVPPECTPKQYNGECHVNFIRKMQASFGWDWGPAFPSAGIWKEIELITYSTNVLIRDLTVKTIIHSNENWQVWATIFLKIPPQNIKLNITGNYTLTVDVNGTKYSNTKNVKFDAKDDVNVTHSVIIPKDKVELWWPNGYGEQPLYNFKASLETAHGTVSKFIKIAFRTAELVQEPISKENATGLTFYVKINGAGIFSKGSNWIPSSIFPENTTNEHTIDWLLKSCKISNMNMLRVWGGGIYESDRFYQLCDEYGIMIWQDMMFACNLYPVNEAFLSSVNKEITQQIRRLQYHPSIVIWAGNNENELALRKNWYKSEMNYTLYKEEYIKLYVDNIKRIVTNIDDSRAFVISSPSNGIETEREGYVSDNPSSPLYGDVHNYNYFVDAWDEIFYPWTRFCSEYGFQSIPSYSTLKTVTVPGNLTWIGSDFLTHRQHLIRGYVFMYYLMFWNVPLPTVDDVEGLVYMSQLHQAWSMKLKTEWLRKNRNVTLGIGRGKTMGALYWQLNDVWVAPSWSSIEFGGKWKMLQYYAKKFYNPIYVLAKLDEEDLVIIAISDLLQAMDSFNLNINVFKYDDLNPVLTFQASGLTLAGQSVEEISRTKLRRFLEHTPCFPIKCFLEITLTRNETRVIDNYLFFDYFSKNPGLREQVNITISNENTGDSEKKEHNLLLGSDGIALFVWLEANDIDGIFSDNGFMITKDKTNVKFNSVLPIKSSVVIKSIKMTTLNEQYANYSIRNVFNMFYS